MAEGRMITASIAAFIAGAVLMVPFESTVTRVIGLICLFAFIVLGAFAIATPERLGDSPED